MKVFLDADASPVTDIVIKVCENLHFELIIVKNFSQQIYSEDNTATGAGNGTAKPTWAEGWTVGF